MKKIFVCLTIITLFSIVMSVMGHSQQSNSIHVVIKSPDYELLSRVPQFNLYFRDDELAFGEIDTFDLPLLSKNNINYQIVDKDIFPGKYYVIYHKGQETPVDKLNIEKVIFIKDDISILKIDEVGKEKLFASGYKPIEITKTPKPLPGLSAVKLDFTVPVDSTIRKIINEVSSVSLQSAVQRLQDFRTRYTFSDSIIPAGQWIYDQCVSFGYTDVKFDTFYFYEDTAPHRNVIATKPGIIYPDSVIMIGGHFDSISNINPYTTAPGAEDNASGTVAAMEAARIFANHDFEATIKFAAWDAEERGLWGSRRYAERAYRYGEPIGLYINFDMIGYLYHPDPLRDIVIYTDQPSRPFAELMADMAKTYTTLFPVIPGNISGSDHFYFQQHGYRAIFGFEGQADWNFFRQHYYHSPNDIIDNMNFDYMKEAVQMGLATIISLAGPIDSFYGKPYVKYQAYIINDDTTGASYGNSNGYMDTGETIELTLTVKNHGDSTAYDATATIFTDDPYITISQGTQSFGSILSQAIAVSQNNFVFQVLPNAPIGHQIIVKLEIKDNQGNVWNDGFQIRVIMPELVFRHQYTNEINGNGDDKIDPGEIFNVVIELQNIGLRNATDITSVLRCDHPSITIVDSLATFVDIPQSGFGENLQDQFTVAINPDAKAEIVPFSLMISEGGGFYQKNITFNLAIGQGKVLLVEDDGGFDLSHYYKDALEILGISYLYWNTNGSGPVDEDTLMTYNRIIWYTGMEFNNSLFKHGTKPLENYLENGGNLFINGSLFPFSVRDSLIMSDYLHTNFINYNTELHHLKSEGTKPVLDDITFWLSTADDNNQSFTGEIDAQATAQPILFYDKYTYEGSGNIKSSGAAAVAVADNDYRVVMFSFGWEGIEDREIRQAVLVKILNWLQDIQTSVGSNLTDGSSPATYKLSQNYPNPFNPTTTIQFDVPQTSHVTIKIYNILGKEIKTLINRDINAGSYEVIWNGKDKLNQPVASGMYFYQMTGGEFRMTRKMILLY